MLRDPSLIPLSHQHHNGLALCVLIRRSLSADSSPVNLAKLAGRAIDRYELELVNHFEIEEEVLFPACGPMPLIAELLEQHRAIETFIAQLRTAPSVNLLEQFCALLSSHIRLEENELFEQVQRALPREVLDQMGSEIDRRAVRVCLSPD
jgi:hemerythrin-like domain-containing protein